MFAPESTANTASSRRNPRRRQRTSLEDSSKPPDAKRQRSALRQEPSRPPTNIDVDLGEGNAFQPDTILKRTGNETRFGVEKNLAIRSSEKTSKPTTSRSDRSVILVYDSVSIFTFALVLILPLSLRMITTPLRDFRLGLSTLRMQFLVS